MISERCSRTIQAATSTKNRVPDQNRNENGWRRTQRSASVTPAAWMTTHSDMRQKATRRFDSIDERHHGRGGGTGAAAVPLAR